MPEAPITEGTEQSTNYDQLLADYILSFRHSQGATINQGAILQYLRKKYSTIDLSTPGFKKIEPKMRELIPPKRHTKIREESLAYNQSKAYAIFENAFTMPQSDLPYSYRNIQTATQDVLGYTTHRDLKYVRQGRPDGSHDSFLRRYGVEGKPTGSAVFDGMYRDVMGLYRQIRDIGFDDDRIMDLGRDLKVADPIPLKRIRDNIFYLEAEWQSKHPGQKFIPEPQPQAA